ncbi:TRPM8 channel-associated factor homolog [Anneissia japonica]|uniref:TRPM8 channel-associated factor homolog n=1 Tax=Anneissia japonica TaxID=1529436 RepID=UPI001425A1AE|nr:TRPM8 channel-associated factor homolog [Anneissia japonica]
MDPTTDQLFLLNNITSLDGSQLVPSKLSIDTTTAFTIFTSQQGNVVAAGSFLNNGKIAVIGHEAILDRDHDNDNDDSPQFTKNVIRWLARGKEDTRIGMLVKGGYNGFRSNMTKAGCSLTDVTGDFSNLSLFDVIFADTYTEFDDVQLSQIQPFLSTGGGLILGGHNWYYKRDWVNKILLGSGITITDVQSDGYQVFTPIHPSPSTSVAGILNGVSELNLDGSTPGVLSLFEYNAFSLVDNNRNIIVAGTHCEIGRMIHFGHEAIVNMRGTTTGDALRLVQNSIGWLTRMKQATSVGFLVTSDGLKTTLVDLGHTVHNINVDDDLSSYSLLFTTTYEQYTEQQLKKIHAYVASGGGLLTGGHNWSGAKTSIDILLPGGMFLTNDYTSNGIIPVTSRTPELQDLLNALNSVKSLISHVKNERPLSLKDQQDIATTLSTSARLPATLEEFWRTSKEFIQLLQPVLISSPLDTKALPVKASYVYLFNTMIETEDVDTMKSYPEASVFPGEVPSVLQPISKSVEIDATYTGLPHYFPSNSTPVWRSTGLYAAPSTPITITVPPEAVKKGVRVLIGCHTDDLTRKETFHRYPRISRSFEIISVVTKAANVFGGLIYITVPAGVNLGKLQVSIDNGYAAPEFVLGKTDDDDWKKSLSDNSVPYCELISEHMILTVQTSEARSRVKSPTEIIKIYRACVDVTNEVSGIKHQRARGERFVLDAQISAGYMHAGYPIMGQNGSAVYMLDIDAIYRDNIWGPVHEIGHQYQTKGWTPSGGSESTNNIFSVYASEKVMNIPRNKAHSSLSPTDRKQRIYKYIADGRKYENWNGWTCLETYLQLQAAFGWDFFVKILGEYNQDMTERPSSNQQILDEWMRRSSRITGYNLGPFYEGWGWPVSQEALKDVTGLPHWDENPMPPN